MWMSLNPSTSDVAESFDIDCDALEKRRNDDVEWKYEDRVVALNSVVDAKWFCAKLHNPANCSNGAVFGYFELFCDRRRLSTPELISHSAVNDHGQGRFRGVGKSAQVNGDHSEIVQSTEINFRRARFQSFGGGPKR
jgi:hypothetical protein